MPRSARVQEEGYLHHVVCCGNNGQDLFPSKEDYLKYVTLLKEARRQFPLKVYNFALVSNHLHLLVEPKQEGSLSSLMQIVTKEYAKYFNKKYDRQGHVFQGRFKSFLLQPQPFFFTSSRHIDFDAVNAKIVSDPKDYPWSGYAALAFGKECPIRLDEHELYHNLGKNPAERQVSYRALVVHFPGETIDFMDRRADIMGDVKFKRQVRGSGK